MIITRAPLRISFVGGGTDIKEFYERYPGRVLSATIDKFIYIIANKNEFSDNVIIKYSETETVRHPSELKHDRFKEGLLKLGIETGLEIASFADLPWRTGLGSSSAFSVALMKALHTIVGKKMSREEAAQSACELEIDILKEPIGKQDQYASAYGGMNMLQFNQDGTVIVEPIFIDFAFKSKLEDHLFLFFTGVTRDAGSVLSEQKKKIDDNFELYKRLSDSVLDFKKKIEEKDIKGMAHILHEGWVLKKQLASSITNSSTDLLYQAGLDAGAWGGKLLGAGGGGCLLFLAPPEIHEALRKTLTKQASELGLMEASQIRIAISQSGVDVLFNSSHKN